MKRLTRTSVILFGLIILPGTSTLATEIGYQQTIKTRCEAIDQKTSASFVIFFERQKIFDGLHPRLIPAACFVEVTQSGMTP
jgi:hypothetical protein